VKILDETLSILARPTPLKSVEVLIGRKLRGPLAGMDFFPGGKLEQGEDREAGARREVKEETGICLPTGSLRLVGDIIVSDFRKRLQAEYIGLFLGDVGMGIEVRITDELEPRWVDALDPHLADNMHPDVQVWWPHFLREDPPFKIHVIHYPGARTPEVIVKQPGYGQTFAEQAETY
jgi:8-oxo-dGTP pyrophosphatase MutT (NUDIX family)